MEFGGGKYAENALHSNIQSACFETTGNPSCRIIAVLQHKSIYYSISLNGISIRWEQRFISSRNL